MARIVFPCCLLISCINALVLPPKSKHPPKLFSQLAQVDGSNIVWGSSDDMISKMWMTSYFNDRAPTNSASAAAKENDSVPQTSWLLKTLEFLLGGDALGFAHHHPEDALGAMLNTPAEIHENVGPNQSFRNAAFAIGGSSDATEVYPLATLSAPAKKALKMKQHFDADFQRGLLRNAAGAHTLFDKDQSPNPLRAVHWPNYKPKKSKK